MVSQQSEAGDRRGERLTVASLNTLGFPIVGSDRAERYRVIADTFETSEVDVVCFQEVFTYHHLRQLTGRMPSFRHVGLRRSVVGPAGGVVVLSRRPIAGSDFHRFPLPRKTAGLPWLVRFKAAWRGALVTRLAEPRLCVVNTHILPNLDEDWSPENRFYRPQQRQLAVLARVVRGLSAPSVVCGDFNVPRDSPLYRDFIAETGLTDVFGDRCPPTLRESPYCIDYILVAGPIKVEATDLLFTDKAPLPGGPGYVSDHIGLCAALLVPG